MLPQDAVEFALKQLRCSQKELAVRLGVSPTQITKWKNGEHMSSDMERRIRELTGIGDDLDPLVVLAAGTLEDAKKWQALIVKLAKWAVDLSETGYGCEPLEHVEDEHYLDLVVWNVFHNLKEMGVEVPKPFPPELESDDDDDENVWEDNPYSGLMLKILQSYNDIWGFCSAYDIFDLYFDDEVSEAAAHTGAENFYAGLWALAATKIEVNEELAPNFREFARQTKREFRYWLTGLKAAAVKVGVPLRAELMDLLYCEHDDLSRMAEAESFGLNKRQIHPDIYMNELLEGMRAIRQILPAITKKLEIDFRLKPVGPEYDDDASED
jgi:transcriptional regulator with XRE-family HTH domain